MYVCINYFLFYFIYIKILGYMSEGCYCILIYNAQNMFYFALKKIIFPTP